MENEHQIIIGLLVFIVVVSLVMMMSKKKCHPHSSSNCPYSEEEENNECFRFADPYVLEHIRSSRIQGRGPRIETPADVKITDFSLPGNSNGLLTTSLASGGNRMMKQHIEVIDGNTIRNDLGNPNMNIYHSTMFSKNIRRSNRHKLSREGFNYSDSPQDSAGMPQYIRTRNTGCVGTDCEGFNYTDSPQDSAGMTQYIRNRRCVGAEC